MTPGSRAAGDTGPTRGAELCSQCEIVVCFSVSFERVLFTWITATARLSLFHTPVETFTPPQVMKSGRLIYRSIIIIVISSVSIYCWFNLRIPGLPDLSGSCRRIRLFRPPRYPSDHHSCGSHDDSLSTASKYSNY